MPPSLEKPKRKKKGYKKLPVSKQKQQQTVIVNINKRTQPVQRAPRNNGIEKPKEKEQPKTYNSFSFSSPQASNPIGDYLKVYQKDLFAKIEQAIKTKDPVINSSNESLNPIIAVERKPTVLETIKPPTTLDNFLKKKEDLSAPLVIGSPVILPDVTTLDEPESISLDDLPEPEPEEKSKDTVETLKKVDEPPDLFGLLSKSSPVELGAEVIPPVELGAEVIPPVELGAEPKKRGRPPLSEEEKTKRSEIKAVITRPVGRPIGSTNDSLRARLNNQLYEDTENPPKFASVKSIPRQQSADLPIPTRIQRRKEEGLFTKIDEPKLAPQRRSSLSFGSRLGSTL